MADIFQHNHQSKNFQATFITLVSPVGTNVADKDGKSFPLTSPERCGKVFKSNHRDGEFEE